MTDYVSLALKYGGFTSLDKVYLENVLAQLSDDQKLIFITPPPSVINAYFAELYQKQSPKAATDYFFDLSKELMLFQNHPSFEETKPFIRLNLSGKSYGFCFALDERALVFPEKAEPIHASLLCELAQVFPHYKITAESGAIRMLDIAFDEEELQDLTPQNALLSHVAKLKGDMIKIKSFNKDELAELLPNYSGQIYYGFEQREYLAYVKLNND
ncbi:cystathionine beta-lyase [Streptococcus dentiloxodontae]